MLVEIKGTGQKVQFPDDMDRESIRGVLRRKFYNPQSQEQRVSEMLTPIPSKAEAYDPSIAERTGQTISDYLLNSGIVSDNYTAQQVGGKLSELLGFIPGIGDAQAGEEFGRAVAKGDIAGAAMAGAGVIPFVGDAAKTGVKGTRTLFKTHNIAEEGLRAQDEIGGLSVPSIAITGREAPMEGFGNISLVGERTSFSKDPTFASDIYSPRFPRAKTDIDRNALKHEVDSIQSNIDERVEPRVDFKINPESLSEDINRLRESPGNKQAFLKSIGQDVNPDDFVSKPEPYQMPDWYINLGMDEDTVYTLKDMDNPEFIERATRFAEKMNPEKDIPGWWDNGALTDKAKRDALKDFRSVRVNIKEQEPKFDGFAMRQEINRRVEDNVSEFNKYVQSQQDRVSKGKYFDVWNPDNATSKKLKYNLDNAVKLMKGNIRGGENFSYGAGNIRSQVTPELKSIDEIMDARGKIIPGDQMTIVKEEIDSELSNLYDGLADNWAWEGEPTFTEFADGVSNAAKGDFSDFKDLSEEQQTELTDFFKKLADAPTEYFEIKPQRAVDVSEFYGAAVPSGTPDDVVDILRKKGLEVEFYDGDNRLDAIEALDRKSGGNIFFSAGGAAVLIGAGSKNDEEKDEAT